MPLITPPYSSWTHKLARVFVRPMLGGPITPNHLTTARLVSGLAACAAFAVGDRTWDIWGGVFWIVSAFLDRADGELARLGKLTSASGHAYDFACDVAVNSLLFLGIGIGARHGALDAWALPLGIVAALSVAAASLLSERLERQNDDGEKAYAGVLGFDFDDVLYLFGPFAWLGWLTPVLIGAVTVAPVLALWTWRRTARRGPA